MLQFLDPTRLNSIRCIVANGVHVLNLFARAADRSVAVSLCLGQVNRVRRVVRLHRRDGSSVIKSQASVPSTKVPVDVDGVQKTKDGEERSTMEMSCTWYTVDDYVSNSHTVAFKKQPDVDDGFYGVTIFVANVQPGTMLLPDGAERKTLKRMHYEVPGARARRGRSARLGRARPRQGGCGGARRAAPKGGAAQADGKGH